MTPEKRKKITALMNNSESTENEKEVCRKLLKDNPETDIQPDMKEAENYWEALNGKSYGPSLEDLLRRQAAAQQASAQWQQEMRFRAALAQQAAAQQRAAFQEDYRHYGSVSGQASHSYVVDWGPIVEQKPQKKKSIFDGLLRRLWRKK